MGKLWIAALPVAALAVAALAPSSCATLNELSPSSCGDEIVEQDTEDCDTFPLGADGGVTDSDAGFACSTACRVKCAALPDAGADAGGDADAGPRCPDGWACGTDDICRQPKGKLTATAPIEEPVDHVQIGDMDGDGRQDVVVDTGSELRVHYFASGASLDQTVSISVEQPTPALGDFNGDGKMDVAYALSNAAAFAVRLGSADRSLPAVPFPLDLSSGKNDLGLKSADRIIAIPDVPIDARAYSLRELLRVQQDSVTTFFGPNDPMNPASFAQPVALTQKAGWADLPPTPAGSGPVDIPTGNLIAGSPCTQFVFPNKTANKIQVYQPCVNVPALGTVWNDPTKPYYAPSSDVKVPPNVQIAGSAYIVDVDGDGNADVAAFVDIDDPNVGNTTGIVVAYGDGTGHFGSSPLLTSDGLAKPYYCSAEIDLGTMQQEITDCKDQQPFAVADFDGDGVLDVVNGCGVFLGSKVKAGKCGQYGTMLITASSRTGLAAAPWTTARVVDLNLDGNLDVVAGSCANSFVSYLENSGYGIFNTYTIPAAGGVDQIAVGDFDGDFVPDVAFSQRVAPLLCMDPKNPDSPDHQSIGVAFGAYSGGPSEPISLAEDPTPLSTIKQLVSSYLVSPAGAYQLTDNLVTVTDGGKGATESILSTFAGNTNRGEIIAPYFLVNTTNGQGDVPWLMTMGKFGSGYAGVGVVASERGSMASMFSHQAELWLTSAQKNGTLSLLQNPPQLVSQVGDPSSYVDGMGKGAWLSTVNLGDPGGDSLLGIAFDQSAGGDTVILTLPPGQNATAVPQQPIQGYFSGPIVVSDIDGDGMADVVLHSANQVAVLWNQGKGSLGAPSLITVPAACGGEVGDLVAVTALRTTPRKQRQIVVLDSKVVNYQQHNDVYLATLDPARSSGPPTFTVSCFDESFPIGPTPGNVILAAGDVDGDGVDDVVVGSPGAVQVFRGAPVNQ